MARTSATATVKAPTAAITPEQLQAFRTSFAANPAHRLAMNACSRGEVDEIALNREVLASLDWHFSHEVEGGAITHQRNAGFCWMYAALNWLRVDIMATHKLESFDFSHNY